MQIPLTQGQFATIDDEDADLILKYSWRICYCKRKKITYAVSGQYSKECPILRMHRVILNAPKGVEVDHENRNGLDNRKQNLRLANPSQNHYNSKTPSSNKSGVKGVDWHKASSKWRAQIVVNKSILYLGVFSDIEDAKIAIHNARILNHGEFARDE